MPRRMLRFFRRLALCAVALAFVLSYISLFGLVRSLPSDNEFTEIVSVNGLFAYIDTHTAGSPKPQPPWHKLFDWQSIDGNQTFTYRNIFHWPTLGFEFDSRQFIPYRTQSPIIRARVG